VSSHCLLARRTASFIVAAALLLALALPVGAGATEAPGVGWAVTGTNFPTNLQPGGQGTIKLEVFNVGEEDSHGTVTVTDVLPPGFTAREPEPGVGGAGELLAKENGINPQILHAAWHCTGNGGGSAPGVDGASVITCENDPTNLPTLPGGGGLPTLDSSTTPGPHGVEERPAEKPILPVIGIAVNAPSGIGTADNEVTVEGGGALSPAAATDLIAVSADPAAFSVANWDAWFSKADGEIDTQAGSHPYELTTTTDFSTMLKEAGLFDVSEPRNVLVKLPPGVIGNPRAAAQCGRDRFDHEQQCPAASIVGSINPLFGQLSGALGLPIFNISPPRGGPAELGFNLQGIASFFDFSLRTGGDYGIDTHIDNIPQREIADAIVTIWGVPADPSHDRWRRGQQGGCPVSQVETNPDCFPLGPNRELKPFLTLPTSCAGPQHFPLTVNTWRDFDLSASSDVDTHDAVGAPTGFIGCNRLPFAPAIAAKPTTNVTDSPSGLEVDIHMPDTGLGDPAAETSEADLKNTTVTLPEGMSVNPAGANGLGACSPAQVGLTSAVGQVPVTMTPDPAQCPNDSKVGSVTVETPLLDHPLEGSVYVAAPQQNPFGSLLALYIAVDDEASGIVLKLPGEVEANPVTGQLTTTFEENPQLPFEDFKLHFFAGAGAALRSPSVCGLYQSSTVMTPWSTPEGADTRPGDSFEATQAPGGGACPTSAAKLPNAPSFSAGTISPKAGAYSPFVLHLARADGTQEFKEIDTTLPAGLIGKLAGVSECSDTQIAQAAARNGIGQGKLEQQSPSCPASSEVGTVSVGAGAGPAPYYVPGHAYLAGPYKGAPLSLEIVTPAVAGPFDLGTVAVRTALYVDPESAQIHAVSDEIPHVLQGIPLDVRSINLSLDRPNFTLNPTNCAKKTVLGSATSVLGQSAALSAPFQVGECAKLGFKPKLAIKLKGGTQRHTFPALTATLTYPQGSYANIASAQVTLPHSEFLEQGHIGTVCTRVQFAAGAGHGEQCPQASVYGFARATTPLLDKPIEGPVYLRSSSHSLPDLVAALNGQIDVDLDGRVDTGKGGGIRNTFEAVPDAPVSKFVLSLDGGKKGLLVNSENLCAKHAKTKAIADFTAQNGKVYDTTPTVANSCKKAAKGKGQGGHGKHHKAARQKLNRLLGAW
jgi:hypothetical protein